MNMASGRALMVITRLNEGDRDLHFDVHTFIQSCAGDQDTRDSVAEEFQCCEWDIHPLPPQAYKLAWGDTIRVAVRFDITWFSCGDGEYSSRLEYTKAVVRRRQPYRERYLSKAARA
jgi:hypothetical protein